MWILCALIIQLGFYGVENLVHITVDDKTIFKYGQTRDSDLNRNKSSPDIYVRKFKRNLLIESMTGLNRNKPNPNFSGRKFERDLPTQSASGVDENGPCKWLPNNYEDDAFESKTFHQALVADEHSRVVLACHYCNATDQNVYGDILWYRVSRGIFSHVNITEVISDMNDDEDKNRVVISPAHALTFKRVLTTDAGGYFCRSEKKPLILDSSGSLTNLSILLEILSVPGQISFLYHLDVIPPIGLKVRQVSFYFPGTQRPKGKYVLRAKNLIFFTDWQEWSRCSTCGSVGERKRYGVRMIAKADPSQPSAPWFLNKVLSTFTKGIPSRSTLLEALKNIPTPPDEIETELCDVACHRTWSYADDNKIKPKITNEHWRDLTFDSKHKVIKQAFTSIVGDVFTMKCPGATIDSMVWWKNGTNSLNSYTIAKESQGRIHIDSLNSLIINPISTNDKGKYSCWINGKLWALIKLNVNVPPMEGFDSIWYHVPYFCTVLTFHFWVFLTSLLLRQAYRQLSPRGIWLSDMPDSSEDAWRGSAFWNETDNWNEEKKEKAKKERLEKYGEGETCADYVGDDDEEEEAEQEGEKSNLFEPTHIKMTEKDQMMARKN